MTGIRTTPRNLLLIVVALIVLYVLSFGPVAWLIVNVQFPTWITAIIATIYSPFDLIPTGSTLGTWFRFYIGLWCDLTQQPKTSPAHPIPALAIFLGVVAGAWMIWNFVGWFSRRDSSGRTNP